MPVRIRTVVRRLPRVNHRSPAIHSMPAGVQQEGSRWRNDDGDEDGATWILAQDSSPVQRAVEVTTRLRLVINTT